MKLGVCEEQTQKIGKLQPKNHIFEAVRWCNEVEKSRPPKKHSKAPNKCIHQSSTRLLAYSIWGVLPPGMNSKKEIIRPKTYIFGAEESGGYKKPEVSKLPKVIFKSPYQMNILNFNFLTPFSGEEE